MNARRRDSDPRPGRLSRRELLQGRLAGLLGPQNHRSTGGASPPDNPPLVMRYPRTVDDLAGSNDEQRGAEPPSQPVASIQGISIAPVKSASSSAGGPQARRRAIPVFRPPGAVEEQQFLSGCTRCGECIEVCPHDAIVRAPESMRGVAGTPVLLADTQPCWMCADTPCIQACEPEVLTDSLPTLMGTARVTEHLCLAHHGTTCTVCSERCPVDDAIRVVDGKPTIREDACTGCGVCRYVCPAPENAILLMPTFHRPSMASRVDQGAEKDS